MNREIKFRLWNSVDNGSKYFYDPREVMVCLKQQCLFNENPESKLGYNHVGDGSAFEQFTGLKDKNGNEIWEGDVMGFERFIGTKHEKIWVVEYSPESGFKTWHSCPDDAIVIGNIHQNPELL